MKDLELNLSGIIKRVVTFEEVLGYVINYCHGVVIRPRFGSELRYGYELYLPELIDLYIQNELKVDNKQPTPQHPYNLPELLSTLFMDVCWYLCSINVLRPSVKNMNGNGSNKPGYSLTSRGIDWVQEANNQDYTPIESERFARIMEDFTKYYDVAFQERAQEAIRCNNNHTYLACCTMAGAAAETMLLVTAEKSGVDVKGKDKVTIKWLTAELINKLPAGITRAEVAQQLSIYSDIIKYWRDAGMHHKQWKAGADEAYLSLKTLLNMAFYVKSKWFP